MAIPGGSRPTSPTLTRTKCPRVEPTLRASSLRRCDVYGVARPDRAHIAPVAFFLDARCRPKIMLPFSRDARTHPHTSERPMEIACRHCSEKVQVDSFLAAAHKRCPSCRQLLMGEMEPAKTDDL